MQKKNQTPIILFHSFDSPPKLRYVPVVRLHSQPSASQPFNLFSLPPPLPSAYHNVLSQGLPQSSWHNEAQNIFLPSSHPGDQHHFSFELKIHPHLLRHRHDFPAAKIVCPVRYPFSGMRSPSRHTPHPPATQISQVAFARSCFFSSLSRSRPRFSPGAANFSRGHCIYRYMISALFQSHCFAECIHSRLHCGERCTPFG